MASRLELHEVLCEVLGNRNVYFNTPSSFKLNYPCIKYSQTRKKPVDANNSKYLKFNAYQVTIIDSDPDSVIPERLEELPYCSFDRPYTADGLSHFVYTIFY